MKRMLGEVKVGAEHARWLLRIVLLVLLIPLLVSGFDLVRTSRLSFQLVRVDDESLTVVGSTPSFALSLGGELPAPFPLSVVHQWRWRENTWRTRRANETWIGEVVFPSGGASLLYVRHPRTLVVADGDTLAAQMTRKFDDSDQVVITGLSSNGRFALLDIESSIRGRHLSVVETATFRESDLPGVGIAVVDRSGHVLRRIRGTATEMGFEVGDIEDGKLMFRRLPAPPGSDRLSSLTQGSMSDDGEVVYGMNADRVHCLYCQHAWQTLQPRSASVFDHSLSSPHRKLALAGQGAVELIDCARGESQRMLVYEGEYFTRVAFSPNGERVAAISDTGTIVVWDAEQAELVGVYSLRESLQRRAAAWAVVALAWGLSWVLLSVNAASPQIPMLDLLVTGVVGLFSASMAAILEYVPWYRASASYSATLAGGQLVGMTVILGAWVVFGSGARAMRLAYAALGMAVCWGGVTAVMRRTQIVDDANIAVYAAAVLTLVLVVLGSLRLRGWRLLHPAYAVERGVAFQWSVREWFVATSILGGALVTSRGMAPPNIPTSMWLFGVLLSLTQSLIVLAAMWAALAVDRPWRRLGVFIASFPLSLAAPLLMNVETFLPLSWFLAFQAGIGTFIFVALHLFRLRGFRLGNVLLPEAPCILEPRA